MKTRILTFTLSIFLCATAARAELKWEQTTADLHPAIGDKQAVAHFKYENVGTTPVHFKSVRASCGCTAAQSQTEQVAPGEKGEVTATFNIGDRTGQQVKTVTVQTDDPNPTRATTILTLRAMIATPFEVKPTFVYWQNGEDPKPKTVMVKASKDFPAKNLTVKSNSQVFTAKVEPGASAGEWKIEVQPKETSRSVATALLVQSDFPKEQPRSFYVNVQVNPPVNVPANPAATPVKNPVGPVQQ
jgi:Protein of unknown function (DUF1573)